MALNDTSRDGRPDPDALLEKLQQDEQAARRGRLRIYFGSNAGVGKTCAMLQAARREQAQGREVVAGIVETHGRSDTAAFARWFWGLIERGVYMPCSQFEALFVSMAHSDRDIDDTIAAANEVLATM